MKILILTLLLVVMSDFVFGMSPSSSSTQQPSLLLSPALRTKKFASLRIEQSQAAQEITGQSGDQQTLHLTKTYGVQYGQYFSDRWIWGLQMGPVRPPFPFRPNLDIQFDFLSQETWKLGVGLMYGGLGSGARYGAGLVGAYSLNEYIKIFATSQWISDFTTYETAKNQVSENFVDVQSKYTLYLLGTEVLMPKGDGSQGQLSFIVGMGMQNTQSFNVSYEEHPSNFKYFDGSWGYLELRVYLD